MTSDTPASDARFEDAAAAPVRLAARDADDLSVLSALVQDAVTRLSDMAYKARERRFAFMTNRYRWEAPDALERVRAGLHFEHVLAVKLRGLDLQDPEAKETPLALLGLRWTAEADGPGGAVTLTFSGGGEARLEVEALEACLRDVSAPWRARRRPVHGEADETSFDGAPQIGDGS